MKIRKKMTMTAALVAALGLAASVPAAADNKELIDANTERALSWLRSSGKDTARLLDDAAGVLVFPDMVKMGFGVGGEFGEGLLLVDGKTVDYYASAGKTFGMGPDADYKAEVIFFMTDEALQSFRANRSWKVGQHAQIPVVSNTTSDMKAKSSSEDLVGVIFSEDGVVADLHLNGDRITRIVR